MLPDDNIVFIIDDDLPVRKSLSLILNSFGLRTEEFASLAGFFSREIFPGPGCILLDVFLDGEYGLELQDKLIRQYSCLPIIYISGQGNIPMSVEALKKGAINFLQKPIDEKCLADAVNEALALSGELIRKENKRKIFETLLAGLTAREMQVFRLLTQGLLNKQIAAELGVAEHTVKIHRGNITTKLGVKSVAEMVHMAAYLSKDAG